MVACCHGDMLSENRRSTFKSSELQFRNKKDKGVLASSGDGRFVGKFPLCCARDSVSDVTKDNMNKLLHRDRNALTCFTACNSRHACNDDQCDNHEYLQRFHAKSHCTQLNCSFVENQMRTPLYNYPPVRRKRNMLTSFQQFLLLFRCLGLYQKFFSASCWKFLFLFFLFTGFPIRTFSQTQQTFHPMRTPGMCLNVRSSYQETLVANLQSAYNALDCSVSFCNNSLNEFCKVLVKCAGVGPRGLFASNTTHDAADVNSDEACGGREQSKLPRFDLFCRHIPVTSLLPINFLAPSQGSGVSLCLEEMKSKVMENDNKAERDFIQFLKTFANYATPHNYSIRWNETDCMGAYKSWICAVHHQVYGYNTTSCDRVSRRPCATYGVLLEKTCPFFRVFNRTKLRGGQPVIMAQGFDLRESGSPDAGCYSYNATVSSATLRSLQEQSNNTSVRVRHQDKRRRRKPPCSSSSSLGLHRPLLLLSAAIGLAMATGWG